MEPEPVDENDELTVRARSRIGERLIDKWLLDDLLGVGGMAAVYAATHRNGKRVAIKILHRDGAGASSSESRARFLREGFVANAVGHKGAVSVLDEDITEDGSPFFVMELFDGETLDHRLRRKGPLDAEEVLSATYHMLDVLATAHEKGIIHRDIKPENVFLTKDANVKVLDFGIAQLRQANASATSTTTKVGHTMGTPSFMAPEQARGRWDEVDARSDVWSVGATMFTLLTGRHVHEAETMNEVLLGAMSVLAKPISLYRPELPREVCEVIDRALSFEKTERWESARAMQAAIGACYATLRRTSDDWARAPTVMATSVSTPNMPPHTATPRTATTARPIARTSSVKESPAEGMRPARSKRERVVLVALTAMLSLAVGSWAVVSRTDSASQVHVTPSAAAAPPPPESAPPFASDPPLETADPPSNAIITSTPEPPATGDPTAVVHPPPPPPVLPKAHPPARHTAAPPPPSATPAAPPPPSSNPLDRRH